MTKASKKKRECREPVTTGEKQGTHEAYAEWLSGLSDAERKTAQEALDRYRALPKRPTAQLEKRDGTLVIEPSAEAHPCEYSLLTLAAAGSKSPDFRNRTLSTMTKMFEDDAGNVSAERYNAGVAIMAAVEPESELEALLAVQMIGANEGALRALSGMRNSEMLTQTQAFGNLANKFMRTFAAQMEQLRKMRSGGEQIVKHIHVHEGGQAVVAGRDINTIQGGGGGQTNYDEQCHAAAAVKGVHTLPGQDTPIDLVPVSGDAERPLQDARRDESGCSQG